jgi:integrase
MVDEMDGRIQIPEKKIRKKHPEKYLNASKIKNAAPGRYADGNGLYLVVDPSGARRWVLRTVIKRKRCELGLGSYSLVPLADAREEAARLRRIARKGGDPLAERRQERRIVPTFEEAAREVHDTHSQTMKNAKCAAQWLGRLEAYAFPVIGKMQVDRIESKEILGILTPVWIEKPETARRVRQLMKRVFDYSRAKGWRSGDNPVEGITRVLPKHNGKEEHFASLPYNQVPEFIQALQAAKAYIVIKLAFELLILTATRTSEALLARWAEIDMDAATWAIPAERMKAKVEHRIPLSGRCIEILKQAKELCMGSEFVFPGRKASKPLSNMAFLMTLRRMGREDITAHGFRSSFRNWAEEKTTTQRSVVEAALAHQVENKVEAAYLRTDLFEKRRRLMDSWAAFATMKPAEKVVKIRS